MTRRLLVALVAVLVLAGCNNNPQYDTCLQAIKASAAPLHAGDPGFNPDLDRDGDGVACENGSI